MEEEAEEIKEKDGQNDEQSRFEKAKYRRWMISYRGKERHPRVMIAKKKTEKRTKKEQKQAKTKKRRDVGIVAP